MGKQYWKGCLNISKTAKFESDKSKMSEVIALQSCENLQTFVWWWGGRGGKFVPHTLQMSVQFCNFEELYISSLVFNKTLSN